LFIRIALILSLLAGLSAVVLNLTRLKEKITNLQSNLAIQTAARLAGENALATTTATLRSTQSTLESVKAEREIAVATAILQAKRADGLRNELNTAVKERDDAQAYLARYRATDMEPEQVLAAGKEIKRLETELAAAQLENKSLVAKVERMEELFPEGPSLRYLPSGFKAKVVAVDPRWHFVVLDAGEAQGTFEHAEVLLARQGKLLGKAVVKRVERDRCVANLLPGWELGAVAEGDLVISALPHS